MRLHYSSNRYNNNLFRLNEAVVQVVRGDIEYMFRFLYRYKHLIEIGWIAFGIIAVSTIFSQAKTYQKVYNIPTMMAQANPPGQVVIQTGTSTDNPQKIVMNWSGQDIITYSTFIAVAVAIVLTKIFETVIAAKKKWNEVDSVSAQGKLSKCEEQLNSFLILQKTKDDQNQVALNAMAAQMKAIQESNDVLNKTVARQVATISQLYSQIPSGSVMASPQGVVSAAPPSPHPADPPQVHP